MLEVKCHIYPIGTSRAQIAALRLSENNRQSANVIGDVLEIRTLLQTNLVSEKQLAKVLGLSPATITRRIKMAQLPLPIIEALQHGELPLKLVEEISGLAILQQQELSLQLAIGQPITPQQVSQMRYARASRNLQGANITNALKLDWQLENVKDTSVSETWFNSQNHLSSNGNGNHQQPKSNGPNSTVMSSPIATAEVSATAICLKGTNVPLLERDGFVALDETAIEHSKAELQRLLTRLQTQTGLRAAHQARLLLKALLAELDNLKL